MNEEQEQPEISRVSYNGLIVDVRRRDLLDGIELLRSMEAREREKLLRSVKKALDDATGMLARKADFDDKMKRDTANDVGIWFANEVIEGRAEQYKAAIN